jgi:hypothetical protein
MLRSLDDYRRSKDIQRGDFRKMARRDASLSDEVIWICSGFRVDFESAKIG